MTNSDYLLKAAIKKVTEKLNEILVDKIEEATNIAQDAPEILKKEFDSLKESIIEEASRMEKGENIQENFSQKAWNEWVALQTMLINERRLDLSNKENRAWLNNQMDLFLSNENYEKPSGYIPEE